MRSLKALTVLRLYVSLSGVIVSCVVLRMLDKQEHHGFQMGFLIAVCAAFALTDVLVNDIFPENYVIESTKRWRHFNFMALAVCYAGCLFFMAQYNEPPGLLMGRLLLDAVAAAWVGFLSLGEVIAEQQSVRKPRKPLA